MQEDCLVFGITVVALAVNSCVPKILRGRGGGGGTERGAGINVAGYQLEVIFTTSQLPSGFLCNFGVLFLIHKSTTAGQILELLNAQSSRVMQSKSLYCFR